MNVSDLQVHRPEFEAPDAQARESTIKNILLHIQDGESAGAILENALSFARGCSAHLSCLHVTPSEAYVAFDAFGGVFVMNEVIKALEEEESQLREKVEKELDNEDVSWDYEQITGSVPSVVAGRAALADFIVTGRASRSGKAGSSERTGVIGDLLHWARTPLLLPASEKKLFDPHGIALIAWDGSFQAANAVRASLGLLKLAQQIQVVQVEEESKLAEFPSTRLLEYLSRHGLHADFHIAPARSRIDNQMVTSMLLTHASAAGAAYMVLGAYSHSRIGEYLFGGVTRSLLTTSPLPIVLAR